VEWIRLAQDRYWWWGFVNAVMNLVVLASRIYLFIYCVITVAMVMVFKGAFSSYMLL
jgi:hypothetical protein